MAAAAILNFGECYIKFGDDWLTVIICKIVSKSQANKAVKMWFQHIQWFFRPTDGKTHISI